MNNEQEKEFRGILQTMLYFSFALIALHLYYFCYNTFDRYGFTAQILNKFLLNLNRSTGFFSSSFITKLLGLFMLGVYLFGNKAKKNLNVTWANVRYNGFLGALCLFGNEIFLRIPFTGELFRHILYVVSTILGFLLLVRAGSQLSQIISVDLGGDAFNEENEAFQQEVLIKENEFSVNIETEFYFKKKYHKGWINVVNPFRATILTGTPGSGKSFAIVNQYIRQHLSKGFSMYVYDYKFPDLSRIAYNYVRKYRKEFSIEPRFYVINFDNPRLSNRCNPIFPDHMTDIVDAQESARTILLNLNKTWINKQGDFFVESPINFLAAVIWYLKKYDEKRLRQRQGLPDDHKRFCTFPHVIEFASGPYEKIFPILQSEPEIENLLQPFASALEKEAYQQLEGQIASARIPLSRLASPALYWVMSGHEFTLDINNPEEPKILCVANNPDRQEVYGAALGLYNARLIKLVNRKGRLKSSLIIDELPTIYFRGLDNLIATARSNKVSTLLSMQDLSQLKRDYGDKEATAIFNTIGNIISGAVVGETAKSLSSRFGKNKQLSQSISITERDTNVSISEKMDSVIPESKISNLSQGYFVGALADNFNETIDQKIFHAKVIIPKEMESELNGFKDIPERADYKNLSDEAIEKMLSTNFTLVKQEIKNLFDEEIARIKRDPDLRHLLPKKPDDN